MRIPGWMHSLEEFETVLQPADHQKFDDHLCLNLKGAGWLAKNMNRFPLAEFKFGSFNSLSTLTLNCLKTF